MDKKVTKNYIDKKDGAPSILATSKKLAKNILTTIVNNNINNLTTANEFTANFKLVITREQKDDLKRLAPDFLVDGLNYNDLTNKQLYKSILLAFKGNYTRVASDKVSVTYDFKETISVMDFWRNVGWQLKGETITPKLITKKGK